MRAVLEFRWIQPYGLGFGPLEIAARSSTMNLFNLPGIKALGLRLPAAVRGFTFEPEVSEPQIELRRELLQELSSLALNITCC